MVSLPRRSASRKRRARRKRARRAERRPKNDPEPASAVERQAVAEGKPPRRGVLLGDPIDDRIIVRADPAGRLTEASAAGDALFPMPWPVVFDGTAAEYERWLAAVRPELARYAGPFL